MSALHYLSWVTGKLAPISWPAPAAKLAVRIFAKAVGANLDEAEKDISEYSSVQNFFTRSLKEGARPIAEGLVSPVDGTLRSTGSVNDEKFSEIKGRKYELKDLLASDEKLLDYKFFNIYLSPQDYHHVHAPCSGKILKIDHIPGSLWPVNDWSIRNIDGFLFANERLVFYIDSDFGRIILVMIAATNVGTIKIPFSDFTTNQTPWSSKVKSQLECSYPIDIKKGDRIGSFLLGSSVLLLAPAGLELSKSLDQAPMPLRLGEGLASTK